MITTLDGVAVHAATGGVVPAGDKPVVLLVHGAGMDASVWSLQTRYLANRGFRAVAVDLPGHGASEGEPLTFIGDMAEWLHRYIASRRTRPGAIRRSLDGHVHRARARSPVPQRRGRSGTPRYSNSDAGAPRTH
ncbi:MAG: alpha/beta fold hydrolase [Acidimicrobiales bacterium]